MMGKAEYRINTIFVIYVFTITISLNIRTKTRTKQYFSTNENEMADKR